MDSTLTIRDRARGLMLGGAVGDALGAVVEFVGDARGLDAVLGVDPPELLPSPLVTDDTQMSMFTAEAMIRTYVRWSGKGIASLTDVTYNAYLRWLRTQGGLTAISVGAEDGWLMAHQDLWSARAPGNTCLGSLRSGTAGSMDERINRSKGCGGVMRTAPIGLIHAPDLAFELGCGNAALTHGHDDGIAPAGLLAELISLLCAGVELRQAIAAMTDRASRTPIAAGTARLLAEAADLAAGPFDRELLSARLGEGWVGHEALAIAVACVLRHLDDPARAIHVAASHRGDSDSTASIAGQILGAAYGDAALPQAWTGAVELRDVLVELADTIAQISMGQADPDALLERFPGV